ncbi:Transcription factor bHLH135 [Senna tora]|uniref:Transcription factor bHLH135 n=1 Tax=Senna tora TaxID=362788 RepID=A0A834X617_9FABA|nr:Transcription factor bHLH135 [Senna tora]
MSSRRRSSIASKLTEDEINELVSRLKAVLPQLNQTTNSKVSISKMLKESCCHIKRLQKEVEELSERLSGLMESVNISEIDEQSLRNLLQQ